MEPTHELFLSIVLVAKNQAQQLERFLTQAAEVAAQCAAEYEIIIVDNCSTDDSIALLQSFCGEQGIANLQVYCLAKTVERDVAAWAGVESALGDYVAVMDPTEHDIRALPQMLEVCIERADVVFGVNKNSSSEPFWYRLVYGWFSVAVQRWLKINVEQDIGFFRILSRRIISYVTQQKPTGLAYRWLPAATGLRKATVTYDGFVQPPERRIFNDIERGIRLLVSGSVGPMRAVTLLSLFGAMMNLLYAFYVVCVAIFKENVEPGWITLSLQLSGMFFCFAGVSDDWRVYPAHVQTGGEYP